MMSPAAPVKLHRIKNHQLYHHYLGDPIEVLMLHDDGTHTFAVVGADLRVGSAGKRKGLLNCRPLVTHSLDGSGRRDS
jgi:predicted cupin superfamily sugar epimerase